MLGYLQNTLELAEKYGAKMIDGSITTIELKALVSDFKPKGIKPNDAIDYTEDTYTKLDAIFDFVKLIGPFLEDDMLHDLNEKLLNIREEENAFLRGTTVARVFLMLECERNQFGSTQTKMIPTNANQLAEQVKLDNFIKPFLNVKLPDAIKAHYVINASRILPELVSTLPNNWWEQIGEKDKLTLGNHVLFNLFKNIINQELERLYLDPQSHSIAQTALLSVMTSTNPVYKAAQLAIAEEIISYAKAMALEAKIESENTQARAAQKEFRQFGRYLTEPKFTEEKLIPKASRPWKKDLTIEQQVQRGSRIKMMQDQLLKMVNSYKKEGEKKEKPQSSPGKEKKFSSMTKRGGMAALSSLSSSTTEETRSQPLNKEETLLPRGRRGILYQGGEFDINLNLSQSEQEQIFNPKRTIISEPIFVESQEITSELDFYSIRLTDLVNVVNLHLPNIEQFYQQQTKGNESPKESKTIKALQAYIKKFTEAEEKTPLDPKGSIEFILNSLETLKKGVNKENPLHQQIQELIDFGRSEKLILTKSSITSEPPVSEQESIKPDVNPRNAIGGLVHFFVGEDGKGGTLNIIEKMYQQKFPDEPEKGTELFKNDFADVRTVITTLKVICENPTATVTKQPEEYLSQLNSDLKKLKETFSKDENIAPQIQALIIITNRTLKSVQGTTWQPTIPEEKTKATTTLPTSSRLQPSGKGRKFSPEELQSISITTPTSDHLKPTEKGKDSVEQWKEKKTLEQETIETSSASPSLFKENSQAKIEPTTTPKKLVANASATINLTINNAKTACEKIKSLDITVLTDIQNELSRIANINIKDESGIESRIKPMLYQIQQFQLEITNTKLPTSLFGKTNPQVEQDRKTAVEKTQELYTQVATLYENIKKLSSAPNYD